MYRTCEWRDQTLKEIRTYHSPDLLDPIRIFPLSLSQKTRKALAVWNFLFEQFSGRFRRCWKMFHRFSDRKCYPCHGLGIFWQGKWLLENRPRLRERSWFSPLRPPQPSWVFLIQGFCPWHGFSFAQAVMESMLCSVSSHASVRGAGTLTSCASTFPFLLHQPPPELTKPWSRFLSMARRAPDYSSNLCPPKIWSIWLF